MPKTQTFDVFADALSGRLCRKLLLGILACCLVAPCESESAKVFAQEVAVVSTNKPPSPAEAMRGYRIVEQRIRNWDIAAQPISEPAFKHMCITLRLDGAVVGCATAFAEDGSAMETVLREVMEEAERKLPLINDATGHQQRIQEAKRFMIATEFGGAPEIVAAQSWEEFELIVQAGREGVAVRVGDRMKSIFPSVMIRQGMNSTYGVVSLANAILDGDPLVVTDPKSLPGVLKQNRGVELLRFATVNLAQRKPGEGPVFMFRGGRVISESEITRDSLSDIASQLGANLMWRFRPLEPGQESGEIPPGKLGVSLNLGRPSDKDAELFETLLSIQALRKLSVTQGVSPIVRERAVLVSNALLAGVGKSWPRNPDAVVSAMAVVASTEPAASGAVDAAEIRERASSVVDAAFSESSGWSDQVAVAARSILVMALVRSKSPLAEPALRSLYAQTPPKFLVSHLPYLVWAEQELADSGAPVPAAGALDEMRTEIWSHQITASDAGEDAPDFIGGIVFTNSANPLPTWQSLRPLCGLGAMAADARLTDATRYPIELVRVARGMRFVRQLMIDEDSVHAALEPERAMYGVRLSLWEGRQPTDVQALAVMAACEAIHAISASDRRNP